MCDFFLSNDFLFGKDLHGIDAARVLFADLEYTTKGASSDKLEEFEIAGGQGPFGLFERS